MSTLQQTPAAVKIAGLIAIVQSVIGLGYAALLLIRGIRGVADESIVYETTDAHTNVAYGTAIFFLIVFGFVIFGALWMMRGHRFGRGPVIMLEILLLLISWYMFQGGQIFLAAATTLSSAFGLVMLFSPTSLAWVQRIYRR
ncbi:hypothetical membrane protein [Corynebacterium kutscheri]|uniref:Hypothetical membrane protein n=1 Tax=Corynebacterium kutscheri TaxID=35755 RepID=A0A0F6R0X5_9CORY|nr:hypothetical protein [Corynebacterium kutscheri]AKE41972.1 hypothetical protein UL82_09160 [Corynebacterium kutscheri]VEH06248.1 hypothetical membrane protein [Corynebacterium kutscheri]VEH10313.1 hypothetical membrane protein [Corynebacterium kutscheri]VEH82164.1 hypothetical membrane protein [Corynebacterium kutscheri]